MNVHQEMTYPGDLSSVNGRMWRFLPLGDPTVDIFVSRDLDSLETKRVGDAVTEWESYNKTFHVMRDSQWHKTEILAGLWGAKNYLLDPEIGARLRTQIVEVVVTEQKEKSKINFIMF